MPKCDANLETQYRLPVRDGNVGCCKNCRGDALRDGRRCASFREVELLHGKSLQPPANRHPDRKEVQTQG